MTLVYCAASDSWGKAEVGSPGASFSSLVSVCVSQGVRHGPSGPPGQTHLVGAEGEER